MNEDFPTAVNNRVTPLIMKEIDIRKLQEENADIQQVKVWIKAGNKSDYE